jgi:hypothetical protein
MLFVFKAAGEIRQRDWRDSPGIFPGALPKGESLISYEYCTRIADKIEVKTAHAGR